VTQARDTATPQVHSARSGICSVILSNARDPGVACGADSSPWAWNDSPSSSRANARDLRVASGGDSSPAARDDNGGVAARNDKGSVAARNDKGDVAALNDEGRLMRAPGGLSSREDS